MPAIQCLLFQLSEAISIWMMTARDCYEHDTWQGQKPRIVYMYSLGLEASDVIRALQTLFTGLTQGRDHDWSLDHERPPNGKRKARRAGHSTDLRRYGCAVEAGVCRQL